MASLHKIRSSLAQRGMLLFIASVLIQLFLIASFLFQTANDKDAISAGEQRDLSNDLRGVVQSEIATILAVDQSLSSNMSSSRIQANLERSRFWTSRLSKHHAASLSQDLIEKLNKKTADLVATCYETLSIPWNQTDQKANSANQQLAEKLKSKLEQTERELEKLLFDLVATQRAQPSANSKNQDHHFWMVAAIIGSLLNITVLITMSIFLSKSITRRVTHVNEKCLAFMQSRRITKSSSAHLPVKDEIGKLEETVEEMFYAITDTIRKQQALFENVHDVLCSIDDKNFCFTAVNQSATNIFGFTTRQLIKSPVGALFSDPDKSALGNLKNIVKQRAQPPLHMAVVNGAPFEAEIRKGDGTNASTLWSVKYVPAESSLLCVVHDITERKAAENLRKEVVQMVNHDLRSPLAAIHIIYTLLQDYGNLNELGTKNLMMAIANTDRMRRLINDLLDIGKLDAGMLQLELADTSMKRVIEQSLQSVQTLARMKEIVLVNKSSSDFMLLADAHRLEQILINLLSNAIKFSPRGESIEVSAIQTNGSVEVSVRDFGRGVPAHMTRTIFDRFSQVYASDASQKGGSGLGLAICKALVQLHQGEIGVESTEGAGSRFYFRIPLASGERTRR